MSNAELHEAAQRMRAAAREIAAGEVDLAAVEGSRAERARNMLQQCLRQVLAEELPRHGQPQDVGPRLARLEQRLDRLTGILGDLLEGIREQQEVAAAHGGAKEAAFASGSSPAATGAGAGKLGRSRTAGFAVIVSVGLIFLGFGWRYYT
jgi:hypothetical protein